MGVIITDISGNVIEDSSRDKQPRDDNYGRDKPEIGDRGGNLRDEYRRPSTGYDVDVAIQPVTPTKDKNRPSMPPPKWDDIVDKTPPAETPVLH